MSQRLQAVCNIVFDLISPRFEPQIFLSKKTTRYRLIKCPANHQKPILLKFQFFAKFQTVTKRFADILQCCPDIIILQKQNLTW